MKKLMTTMFAALIGLALTLPAIAQNTPPAKSSTSTQDTGKDTSKDKKGTTKGKSNKKKGNKKTTDSSTDKSSTPKK